MTFLVLSVSVVLITSALCSLIEAVLYSTPISHIESMAQAGRSSGRILKKMRAHVDRPIAAILSLNTIANTGGAAVAGAAAAAVYGPENLVVFSAVLTLAILIFAEVVPKTAGVVYSRTLSGIVAWPLQWLVWIGSPFVWMSRGITRLLARGRTDHGISDEELIVMARLGLQAGTIEADELRVIENILELERRKAGDIMTPRSVMVALPQQMTVEEARSELGVLAHSRIPIFDKSSDDVVGIVHRREIHGAMAESKGYKRMEELMVPVHFVTEATPLDRLLRHFLERRQHLVVVIDEHGGVAGIVTLEDVLEEILGREIVDEYDQVADMREKARLRRDAILKNR